MVTLSWAVSRSSPTTLWSGIGRPRARSQAAASSSLLGGSGREGERGLWRHCKQSGQRATEGCTQPRGTSLGTTLPAGAGLEGTPPRRGFGRGTVGPFASTTKRQRSPALGGEWARPRSFLLLLVSFLVPTV